MPCTTLSALFVLCCALVLSLCGTAHARKGLPVSSQISRSYGDENTGAGSSGSTDRKVLEQVSPLSPGAGDAGRLSLDRNKRTRKFSLSPVFDKRVTGGMVTFAW